VGPDNLEMRINNRVARFFFGTKYQNEKNILNYHELYQMSIKYNKRP
jgi:hypothetical protein